MSLTKLQAVNRILTACGQKPSNSIDGTTSATTRMAVAILEETDQQVQGEGWHFNTNPNHTFTADGVTGEVAIPAGTVRFKVYDLQGLTVRGSKLYDRHRETFDIGRAVTGLLVQQLEFEDLPIQAQEYITCRAARKMYTRTVGSQDSARALALEETQARGALINHDVEEGQYTMMDDPTFPWITGSHYLPATIRKAPRY